MAKISNLETTAVGEDTVTLLVGMPAGAATMENSTEVPQEVENRANL